MNLKDLECILETRLFKGIDVHDNTYVNMEGVWVIEGRLLAGESGRGKTVAAAKKAYCEKIQGKRVVIRAGETNRLELQLPAKISWR